VNNASYDNGVGCAPESDCCVKCSLVAAGQVCRKSTGMEEGEKERGNREGEERSIERETERGLESVTESDCCMKCYFFPIFFPHTSNFPNFILYYII
jgi:hypothetical protein